MFKISAKSIVRIVDQITEERDEETVQSCACLTDPESSTAHTTNTIDPPILSRITAPSTSIASALIPPLAFSAQALATSFTLPSIAVTCPEANNVQNTQQTSHSPIPTESAPHSPQSRSPAASQASNNSADFTTPTKIPLLQSFSSGSRNRGGLLISIRPLLNCIFCRFVKITSLQSSTVFKAF